MDDEIAAKGPGRPPVLTWIGAALSLLFIVPFVALWHGKIDGQGREGELLGFAFYGVPWAGILILWAGGMLKERAAGLRHAFGSLYGLWAGLLLLLWIIFGVGNRL